MKTCFKKAEDWRKSSGVGLLESDENISGIKGKDFMCIKKVFIAIIVYLLLEKLNKICPFYEELKHIFGEKTVKSLTIYDSESANTSHASTGNSFFTSSKDISEDNCEQEIHITIPTTPTPTLLEPPTIIASPKSPSLIDLSSVTSSAIDILPQTSTPAAKKNSSDSDVQKFSEKLKKEPLKTVSTS